MATYWITKYAATHGISKVDGEVNDDFPNMLVVGRIPCSAGNYYHGNEWQRTREEAEARGQELLDRRVALLKKQLANLEGATFNEDGSLCPACKVK